MKSFFRIISFLFITCVVLSILIVIATSISEDGSYEEVELYEYDSLNEEGIIHSRLWEDPAEYNRYFMEYVMLTETKNQSQWYRNNYKQGDPYDYHSYWGNVYRYLAHKDSAALNPVVDSLLYLANSKRLNHHQIANMVVSFVQDIPYSFIMSDECPAGDTPCIDNQRFGILSPVEFLYTLDGDCDTRTTLLYALLNKLGYKTVVFVSDQYAHAMLGVNLPATGDYIRHKGRKFYFWETTNVGWNIGMIPNDMNNINYWKIALDYGK